MQACAELAGVLQVALVHKPSQTLIPGDTFAHMAAKQGQPPETSLPPSREPLHPDHKI